MNESPHPYLVWVSSNIRASLLTDKRFWNFKQKNFTKNNLFCFLRQKGFVSSAKIWVTKITNTWYMPDEYWKQYWPKNSAVRYSCQQQQGLRKYIKYLKTLTWFFSIQFKKPCKQFQQKQLFPGLATKIPWSIEANAMRNSSNIHVKVSVLIA